MFEDKTDEWIDRKEGWKKTRKEGKGREGRKGRYFLAEENKTVIKKGIF